MDSIQEIAMVLLTLLIEASMETPMIVASDNILDLKSDNFKPYFTNRRLLLTLLFSASSFTIGASITSATSFPQAILSAATFDSHLWYRIGQAIGAEVRAIYHAGQATGMTFWARNINIFRDPRWGRGQETAGEDPQVSSKYAVSYGGIITNQIKRLGASCDWTREHFTLDGQLSRAVIEAFVRLHEKGLIYQGSYMVNWSPTLQTVDSHLEVEYSEEFGFLYYIKYCVARGSSMFLAWFVKGSAFGKAKGEEREFDESETTGCFLLPLPSFSWVFVLFCF
ncbi:hypothetical protein K1719_027878 [Acacia pycnantha]|nr:hypothetical protein K1719_027878 [Acacia pycnantha]